MNVVDQIAADIDELLDRRVKLDDPYVMHDRDYPSLVHNPRGRGPQPEEGPGDPWCAWCGRTRGSGQTAEMALLDFKATLEQELAGYVERARVRLAEDSARVESMAALLRPVQKESDKP